MVQRYSEGSKLRVMLVPPGTYDIYLQQNRSQQAEKVKEGIVVRENELVEVEVRL